MYISLRLKTTFNLRPLYSGQMGGLNIQGLLYHVCWYRKCRSTYLYSETSELRPLTVKVKMIF